MFSPDLEFLGMEAEWHRNELRAMFSFDSGPMSINAYFVDEPHGNPIDRVDIEAPAGYARRNAPKSQTAVHIRVTPEEFSLLKKMIKAIYMGTLEEDVTTDTALALLQFSTQFGALRVSGMCLRYLIKELSAASDLFGLLRSFQEFQIQSPQIFRDKVSTLLVDYFGDLEGVVLRGFCERQTAGGHLKENSPLKCFINLPADITSCLLSNDEIRVSTENSVFTAARIYHFVNEPLMNPEELVKLYKAPRYHLMHPIFLRDFVLKSDFIHSNLPISRYILDQLSMALMSKQMQEARQELQKPPRVENGPSTTCEIYGRKVIRHGHQAFKQSGVVPSKQRTFFVSQGAIMFVRGHWTERMLLALPFTFNDDNVSLTTVMDTKIRIHIGGGETRDAPATEEMKLYRWDKVNAFGAVIVDVDDLERYFPDLVDQEYDFKCDFTVKLFCC